MRYGGHEAVVAKFEVKQRVKNKNRIRNEETIRRKNALTNHEWSRNCNVIIIILPLFLGLYSTFAFVDHSSKVLSP